MQLTLFDIAFSDCSVIASASYGKRGMGFWHQRASIYPSL
jgi:hypothetical protein